LDTNLSRHAEHPHPEETPDRGPNSCPLLLRPTQVTTLNAWTLQVWGSRGGVAIDGPHCVRHGGATTCIEIDTPHARIFLDAGTGLAAAGRARAAHDLKPTLLFFTHLHADHVTGFPFWSSLFQPGWDLTIAGVPREGFSPWEFICNTHRPPLFPVPVGPTVQARVHEHVLPETGTFEFHGIPLAWTPVWHPGGCSAVSLLLGRQRIVFTGDLEMTRTDIPALQRFTQDADLLICDAQYTERQYLHHHGWGHSTNLQAARLARQADVGALLLTHHDPRHDDDTLDAMVAEARTEFAPTAAAGIHTRMIDRIILPTG
jgi:ribonuclease BN (tRNA processing enzyme)